MTTLEVIILGLFAVFAVYLMFIHYKLIHRDYISDLNKILLNNLSPVLKEFHIFFKGTKSDLAYQSEQIEKQLKEQRDIIVSQSRMLERQNELIEKFQSAYKEQIDHYQRENKFLYDDLRKTQNTLLKLQKKEARGNPDDTIE